MGIKSGGYGILDVVFLPNTKIGWAVGGGGTIFGSKDGGATWQKDKSADDLPTNLYKIKFLRQDGLHPRLQRRPAPHRAGCLGGEAGVRSREFSGQCVCLILWSLF